MKRYESALLVPMDYGVKLGYLNSCWSACPKEDEVGCLQVRGDTSSLLQSGVTLSQIGLTIEPPGGLSSSCTFRIHVAMNIFALSHIYCFVSLVRGMPLSQGPGRHLISCFYFKWAMILCAVVERFRRDTGFAEGLILVFVIFMPKL